MEKRDNQNCIDFHFDYSKLHTYSGYLKNNEKLLKSASGGAITAVAEEIIKRGGVVFGAAYSNDFKRAEYKCVDNLKELDLLKGSKYCETVKEIVVNGQSKSVYSVLGDALNEGRLVLFVGPGCDVGAVRSYCDAKKINTEKLYLIDILCHGPTSAMVHRQYVDSLEEQYKSKITFFTVRYKKIGWTPFYIHAEFENGKIYEIPFHESDYGFAFHHFSKSGCYSCQFKGERHKSDMTCGDFWGIRKSMDGWNENGVSIMFVRTTRGEELIEMIDRANYHIEEADTAFALKHNPMYYKCREQGQYYDKFGKDLATNGLHFAVQHYPVSYKTRAKKAIKKVLPKSAISVINRILSR